MDKVKVLGDICKLLLDGDRRLCEVDDGRGDGGVVRKVAAPVVVAVVGGGVANGLGGVVGRLSSLAGI